MTDVKICGIMSEADVASASEADYLGFVLMTDSRRCLTVARARTLMALTDRRKVVVTTIRNVDAIIDLVNELHPDVVQVHSRFSVDEMVRLRESLSCELWLLLPVMKNVTAQTLRDLRRFTDKVVLDTPSVQGGGSGETHDWNVSASIAQFLRPTKCVLAGGLDPDNVGMAISTVHPDVVDVSSGVEENGVKSAALIDRFIENARKK
ncbi:MAG: phosphoribosylanthranilate isomerase [Euryarchaeota archaeon]|nr:phosphoribosylanthranilate isomerase [Euryarchaeota archaeon]